MSDDDFDDLHVVVKMANGYNVGIHVDRITAAEEVGYKQAVQERDGGDQREACRA